jgi:hypothetical protein
MTLKRFRLTLLLACLCPGAFAQVAPGLYFDPDHNGHGFDLQSVGGQWIVVLYTYDDQGAPEWMLSVANEPSAGLISGQFDRFDYAVDREPAQQSLGVAGTFEINFSSGCPNQAAAFDFEIDGQQGHWCVQSLLARDADPASNYTGLWYAGESDAGWGLSLDFQGSDAAAEVQVLFYYDADGQPRWSLGQSDASAQSVLHSSFSGYCRVCEPVPLTALPSGSIEHDIEVIDGWPAGTIQIDVDYAFDPGGQWQRQESPLILLSDPARGVVPLPDQVEPDRSIAIIDVNVIPMRETDVMLTHQTVVLSNGQVNALGARGTVAIPDDAVRIDGRDLYLGPGLMDMHTHFTFGGRFPMQEAGILFIANGVTTVLNMGDGGSLDLQELDGFFASGELIGPAVYAGQAVYGPADNRSAVFTVTTPSGATAFAQRIADQGYDFIKVYNSLAPEVVQQFMLEGERLGLPVIGHLPKTITMRRALETGQKMVAHVAEVYFTFFANQQDETLLAPAAEELKEFNIYLTDTLTASESFAGLFGGNEQNFTSFSQREGVQYQPPSFLNAWRNFFESNTLQPAGSQPGQLDARLVFFKQMVKSFNDAGVPIILGTDSPGHTGVISGFSVHENLRIYREIGLSQFDAYAAGSRNPGRFFDDTLAPAVPFGTVEVGARADLLLLTGDPLGEVANLKRPLAVITRGRLYSREVLDGKLAELDAKYPDPSKSESSSEKELSPAWHDPDY